MELVHPGDVQVGFTGREPVFVCRTESGELVEGSPKGVFTRLGGTAPDVAFESLRMLEMAGVPCVNGSASLAACRDKASSCALLAGIGVPFPASVVLTPKDEGDFEWLSGLIKGPPWVLKIPKSSGGKGVFLVESKRSLSSVGDMLASLGQRVLVQTFIEESSGADTRVLVIGGKVVGGMKRQGRDGEFRSNIHKGGSAVAVPITPELEELAIKTVDAFGLKVAGVDIIHGCDGPLVMEVNGSPGLEGISKALGVDTAETLLDYLQEEWGK